MTLPRSKRFTERISEVTAGTNSWIVCILILGAGTCCPALCVPAWVHAAQPLTNYVRRHAEGRSILFTTRGGERLRLTPYGNYILRVQAVRKGEDFFPDDRYEMVESHAWSGALRILDKRSFFQIGSPARDGLMVRLRKNPMRFRFYAPRGQNPILADSGGISWEANSIHTQFRFKPDEHFTGLGHGFYGRSECVDLRGEALERNYGSSHGQQAPLIVPFYLSSRGYGIFLNSTFPNSFCFGRDGAYEFSIREGGRMDYFFILGPDFPHIIDRYTQLTGRPRFPPLAMFGLALSDKGNDHTSSDPSDENWWKRKVMLHRESGFPIDHLVNDNRWRAGGGKRCESFFAWDSSRFPNPAEYDRWVKANSLVVTLDFNRCIAKQSDGWKSSFNIPGGDSIEFGDSAPDFTRQEVRKWFWNLCWRKSLNPDLAYPGDALWIDEFDEMGKIPSTMILGNGRTWMEMKNYWFFLIAKTLVQEGWDKAIGTSRRPFVWVRGMTAGAQRYATLWSGDIRPDYVDMKAQVRSMQLAGLSGFPYWGHDAGGFHDWESGKGPDDAMYRQWSMAFGSFSPFWKPHGMGKSRWPLDRSIEAQQDAKIYCELRYSLMPYTYTYAHEASTHGTPLARAMVIDEPQDSLAWTHDLQYMWGRDLLVAPNCSDSNDVSVWLPGGTWYDFWDDTLLPGHQVMQYPAPTGKLPLFVRAGSILPMVKSAPGTAFLQYDSLTLRVYTGHDGAFSLYEDDGVSELFRTKGEKRTTEISFTQSPMCLKIHAARGAFRRATARRTYHVEFHGLSHPVSIVSNSAGLHGVWDTKKKCLSVVIMNTPVTQDVVLGAGK